MTVSTLLTVAQVAELLGTTERFPRRLIEERRIEFVHVGISEAAVHAYLAANTVHPVAPRRRMGVAA